MNPFPAHGRPRYIQERRNVRHSGRPPGAYLHPRPSTQLQFWHETLPLLPSQRQALLQRPLLNQGLPQLQRSAPYNRWRGPNVGIPPFTLVGQRFPGPGPAALPVYYNRGPGQHLRSNLGAIMQLPHVQSAFQQPVPQPSYHQSQSNPQAQAQYSPHQQPPVQPAFQQPVPQPSYHQSQSLSHSRAQAQAQAQYNPRQHHSSSGKPAATVRTENYKIGAMKRTVLEGQVARSGYGNMSR